MLIVDQLKMSELKSHDNQCSGNAHATNGNAQKSERERQLEREKE